MNLKDLLGEALYGQVTAAIDAHNAKPETKDKVKLVDLGEGGYVSKEKHADKTSQLQAQVDDLKAQAAKRDEDLQNLSKQLTEAKTDSDKLAGVQTSLSELQTRYDMDKQDWLKKMEAQAYEFLVKEKAGELRFSSTAAKKAFIAEAIEKGFKVDGTTLHGYGDWLKEYQTADPGAFAPDEATQNPKAPTIVSPVNPGGNATPKSVNLAEMMAQANANPNYKPNF